MPITSVRSGLDERADLFPAELLPLFDSRFIVSWDLFEEYIARLALQIFRSIGLERPFEDAATVRELVGRAQLDPLAAPIPVAWILSILAQRAAGYERRSWAQTRFAIEQMRAYPSGSERNISRSTSSRPDLLALVQHRCACGRPISSSSARTDQRRAGAVWPRRHQRMGQVFRQYQSALCHQQHGGSDSRAAIPRRLSRRDSRARRWARQRRASDSRSTRAIRSRKRYLALSFHGNLPVVSQTGGANFEPVEGALRIRFFPA